MSNESIVLLGVGDVGPTYEPVEPFSSLVRSTLAGGDIRFAQCERLYSERGAIQVHAGVGHTRLKPHMASIFSDCGFNVVSMASNHSMDWGPDALLDSIDVMRKRGIQTVGAGRNLEEARQPAIIEHNGIKVAILGYCSVLKDGYAAGPNKAGPAPLRVHTSYRSTEYQAGIPPRIITVPYDEDLEGMVDDIANAKKSAHIVVVSVHWGLHFIPRMIAEYQSIAAEAAFKAGADIILGHHAHAPKAIGVHGGKVCFYSLGNFIMTAPAKLPHETPAAFSKHYGVTLDPDYSLLPGYTVPYGTDATRSLIAKAVLTREGINKVSFLPVQINRHLRPEVLRNGDLRFDGQVKFMDWASEDFNHKFTVEGDEVDVK